MQLLLCNIRLTLQAISNFRRHIAVLFFVVNLIFTEGIQFFLLFAWCGSFGLVGFMHGSHLKKNVKSKHWGKKKKCCQCFVLYHFSLYKYCKPKLLFNVQSSMRSNGVSTAWSSENTSSIMFHRNGPVQHFHCITRLLYCKWMPKQKEILSRAEVKAGDGDSRHKHTQETKNMLGVLFL